MGKKLIELLKKQQYKIIGNHSAVKICEWTKKSLIDKGNCFKNKFYGIDSFRCCQMSPSVVYCQNKCLHCWRAIEFTSNKKMNKNKIDNPVFIIDECIKAQRKLISGFKGNSKTNLKKFTYAQEPMNFAISLIGEPSLYPKIGELIKELRKRGKTSFLVTNGLCPEVLEKLNKKKQLPTQLYVSLNAQNKELYNKWHRSSEKNAWKKLNKTLELFPRLKTRKVIRITLVKGLNNNEKNIKEFAQLIKKASPDFIEIKSFMSIGFARNRLGYEKMLSHKEVKEYSKKLLKQLGNPYKILDEQEISRIVLIGKDREKMRIKNDEI